MPVFRLDQDIVFPHPSLAESNGLLAVGGDLAPSRLLTAYRYGIFPWYSQGDPILWWSPSPRLVLFPEEFHLPRRLARTMKQNRFTITADQAFDQVIRSCAGVRADHGLETWITPEMMEAYKQMHRMGFGHSIECWQDERLVGGLYGIAMDQVFFGESMFSIVSDASKICFASLVSLTPILPLRLIDCQMTTSHLLQFGCREISGSRFQDLLDRYIVNVSGQKKWRLLERNRQGGNDF